MADLLVINSQRISTYRTASGPRLTDLLPITSVGDDPLTSRKLTYEDFSNNAIHRDVAQQDYIISSAWTWNGKLEYRRPSRTMLSTDVATVNWFYETCYDKLVQLSTLMYGDQQNRFQAKRKPSYIGMVITSDTLDSVGKVRAIYGQNTDWKPIRGRFLLATGSNSSNTMNLYGNNTSGGDFSIMAAQKMGGAKEVQLTEKNIPPHTHRFFTGNVYDKKKLEVKEGIVDYGKIPRIKGLIEPKLEGGGEIGIVSSDEVANNADWGATSETHSSAVSGLQGGGVQTIGHKDTVSRSRHKRWNKIFNTGSPTGTRLNKKWPSNDGSISIWDLWGGKINQHRVNGTFQAKINIHEMVNSKNPTEAHDNMPPYLAEYIWERVM